MIGQFLNQFPRQNWLDFQVLTGLGMLQERLGVITMAAQDYPCKSQFHPDRMVVPCGGLMCLSIVLCNDHPSSLFLNSGLASVDPGLLEFPVK